MDIYTQTYMLSCTCSKSKLPALITIPNCTVILFSCLKSYKWGKQSEEEVELPVPMYSSSLLTLVLFCYSFILSVFSVENSQTRMGSTVPSYHICPIWLLKNHYISQKLPLRALSQQRPEHSLQYRGNFGRT